MQTMISHEEFDPRVKQNGDDALLVKFMIQPREDKAESEKEGRPVFKDTEYISIRAPGAPDEVVRPATAADKERFPRHYAAFKNRVGDEEYIEGTLLSEWVGVTRSQAEELAFFGVKTVEQLAGMSDSNLQGRMGFSMLRTKARDYLAQAEKAISVSKLQSELDSRDDQIAELKAMVEELSARVPKQRKKKATAKKE